MNSPLHDAQERAALALRRFLVGEVLPISSTEHFGDPGLLGPDSVSWMVLSDPSTLFGGVRALLQQACHPLVLQGVFDHSTFREDPLGRLRRTVAYVLTTTYGATCEVEQMAARINHVHGSVSGVSVDGTAYSAEDSVLKAWVHCSLTQSILEAWQVFGPRRLSLQEADQFVEEQSRIAALLGVDAPKSVVELDAAMSGYWPVLGRTAATPDAVAFLVEPPVPWAVKLPYAFVVNGAVGILPEPYLGVLDLRTIGSRRRVTVQAGKLFCAAWRVLLPSNAVLNTATERIGR